MTPTRTRWRLLAPLALAAAATVAAACQPAIKATPTPGRTAMAGDSIGLQANFYGGGGTDATSWDTDQKIGLGWQAENAQPRVTADVATAGRSPARLVVEFGHNYATGFTTGHRNAVLAMLYSPDPSACVVAVLPYAPSTLSAAHRQAIAQYRQLLATVAELRPHTVLVDWQPIAQAHPDYLAADGVHLNITAAPDGQPQPAAQAFIAMLGAGLARCG